MGFPFGSVVKNLQESACNAGEVGSVPGLGSLEDCLEEDMAMYCLENPTDRGTWWATVHRVTNSQTQMK